MNKIRIATNAAPPSIGTHSQAIRTGDLVFLTGQTGRDPETGQLEEGLEAQTHRMLANVAAVLNAAGCTPADIVKVTLAAHGYQELQSGRCDLCGMASGTRRHAVACSHGV